jgi:hypothetical protein
MPITTHTAAFAAGARAPARTGRITPRARG